MKVCSIENCSKPLIARGFCENHYRTFRRTGHPLGYVNQQWGHAKTIRADGYIYITRDGKQVMEHRWLLEQYLGRKLLDSEVVHHINGRRRDNRIENLQIMSKSDHAKLHDAERVRLNGKFSSLYHSTNQQVKE